MTTTWTKSDTVWMLGLYGTAIGAGVLFLPINAGIGGLIPLLIMALIALPMTYYSHRALCRFVLSGHSNDSDITEVVEEHFGSGAGKLITLLYFFAIYPILLVYSVAITNTVESFLVHQLHLPSPPRVILSFVLLIGLLTIVRLGSDLIVKAMSILVYPFVASLMLLALYLIPYWNGAIFETVNNHSSVSQLLATLWLAIPVMVFSFNHSPIISSFALAKRREYGRGAEEKCSRILFYSHMMMVLTVMFFVFSCALTLSPENLLEAKAQNISILSYLANYLNTPIVAAVAPIIALIAISKSFLGHYLGAKEGLNGIIIKSMREHGKTISKKNLNRLTTILMFVTAWVVATLNPSILGMIETLGGPIIAILLFLMPMYAIHKVPAMKQYRGKISNIFITLIGVIAITAIIYELFS